MSKFTLGPNECLVSYDVTALFTSVPVEECLSIIKDLLSADDTLESRTDLNPQQVTDLLEIICLKTTYFMYDEKFYIQREDATMGSPVSPIIANLFMENFEEKAISSFHTPPRYWGRYVDDTMVIIDRSQVDNFTKHLNSVHNSIKFTIEHENNNSIAMLDTLITRNPNGSLSFSVYRKSTHTDQYLSFSSHQPLEHKLGVIRTLTHRAKVLSSDAERLEHDIDHVKKSLAICGYTQWAWSSPASKKLDPKPKHQPDSSPKGHITMPYVQGVSEPLNRIIRKNGVVVHAKPTNTIRSMLGSPKDKPDMLDKTGTVYHYTCQECPSHYIGETERPLRKGSVNIREIPLLWVLTAKSPSTLLTRNNSRSWTQTRDGTKEASRKPYTLLPGNRIWTRIWDATHSRKPTRNWSSHVTWDRPPGRYPGHVTRPAKRQPAISNISAEEVISDETRKFHVSFL